MGERYAQQYYALQVPHIEVQRQRLSLYPLEDPYRSLCFYSIYFSLTLIWLFRALRSLQHPWGFLDRASLLSNFLCLTENFQNRLNNLNGCRCFGFHSANRLYFRSWHVFLCLLTQITFVFSLFKLALPGSFRAPLFLLKLSTTFLVLLSSRQTFEFSCALWYLLRACASLQLFALVQDAGAQVLQVRLTPAWHQQSRPLAHVHGFVCVLQLFSNVLSNHACDVDVLQSHQTLSLVR